MNVRLFLLLSLAIVTGCSKSSPTGTGSNDSTNNNNNNNNNNPPTHIGWSVGDSATLGQANAPVFFAVNGSDLFLCTQWGVYYSSDSGKTLQERDRGLSFSSTETNMFVKDNYLFVGLEGNGNFRSADKGLTWQEIDGGQTSVTFFPSGNAIYAGTNQGSIPALRSTDDGSTWQSVSSGLPQTWGNGFTPVGNALYIAPGYPTPAWYKSVDGGNSWSSYSGPLSTILTNNYPPICSAVTANGTMLIGHYSISSPPDPVSVYGAPAGTDNWTAHNSGLNSSPILSIVVSGKNVFAAGKGLFRSSDNGSTWTDISPANVLFGVYFNTLAISQGYLIAAGTSAQRYGVIVRRPLTDFN